MSSKVRLVGIIIIMFRPLPTLKWNLKLLLSFSSVSFSNRCKVLILRISAMY